MVSISASRSLRSRSLVSSLIAIPLVLTRLFLHSLFFQQHFYALARRIVAHRDFGRLLPLSFGGTVHGVRDVCRASLKSPGESVAKHGQFRVDKMAVVVGAHPV